jgi:hypothetical protein
MGQLLMALLLPALLLQAPATKGTPGGTPGVATGQQAEKPVAAQTERQSAAAAPQPAPASPAPESQRAIELRIEEKLREALGQETDGDGDRQMSPETEKAIATAVEKFLADPAIKGAIAEKIHQVTPPGHAEMLTGIFVPITFFGLIGLIVWFGHRSKQARLQAQLQAQTQLLGKFSTGAELAAFLATPAGQQFTSGLAAPQLNPQSRVLRHGWIGAICTALGLVMMIFGHGGHFPGAIVLAVGVGYLTSAVLTHRLAGKTADTAGSNMNPPAPTPPPQ